MGNSSSITNTIPTFEPYQLPRYVSNKVLLMEMMRYLAYLHEHIWQMKSATSNLPIIVGEYHCKAWADVDSMKEELEKFNLNKMTVASHYDPEHKIHDFYIKERKRAYEHWPLRGEKPFRNISSEEEMKKVHAKMQEAAQKQQQHVEAAIDKKMSQLGGRDHKNPLLGSPNFP